VKRLTQSALEVLRWGPDGVAEALSISDAARATGVSAHTLRYYERAGLMLDRVGRASSSHRGYTDDEVRRVVLLTKLRSTGMPIRRMREYADLVRAGDGNEAERLALLESHRTAVRSQLAAMERNLAAIDHKIEIYRERLGE
jgi:DNA-binding transcriptional MerR regulator